MKIRMTRLYLFIVLPFLLIFNSCNKGKELDELKSNLILKIDKYEGGTLTIFDMAKKDDNMVLEIKLTSDSIFTEVDSSLIFRPLSYRIMDSENKKGLSGLIVFESGSTILSENNYEVKFLPPDKSSYMAKISNIASLEKNKSKGEITDSLYLDFFKRYPPEQLHSNGTVVLR